jgi:hypothetical protein
MKAGVWAPDITPLPARPRGVGDCRRPYVKRFALSSATASGGCGDGFADTRQAESGAVAGGNRTAERSGGVSPGVGAVRADRAAGCGALGCRETQRLWRVTVAGQRRVLCAVHAVRWLQREGADTSILPLADLPPRKWAKLAGGGC